MKVLKENSDFAKRVENVMRAMEENNVMIEFCAGEFRFSDTSDDAKDYCQRMPMLDKDNGRPIYSLPSPFGYALVVFNS